MGCHDCGDGDRRQFLKTALMGTAGAAVAAAVPRKLTESETLVTTLYHSLTAEQKSKMAFPFDHDLRSKVDNNWFITPARIGKSFTPDQQKMIEEIFRGLHNPEFVDKVMQHMKEDAGGFGNYTIALFGEPARARSNSC